MKRSDWTRVGSISALLVVFFACAKGWADTKENPYEAIVERNPFGLKPPPPPPDPSTNAPPAVAAPLATVELTGITDILGNRRALLEIVPGPGKQMIKPILAEGERVESVEVVAINMEKNEVTVKNGTVVSNLTFKVVKATATAAAPAGTPPPAFKGAANPLTPPIHQAVPQSPYAQPSSRNSVMVGGGAPSVPNPVTPVTPTGAVADGFRSIPSRNIRTTAPQGQPSLEEHYIMTELNRGTHNLPLPPTPLNPNPQYPVHRGVGGTPNTPGFPNIPPVPGGNPQ